ncbi:MAG: DinB family protein [Bacteroidia bacterium]|nr:DinB family protein [Bacteroidia bacterium]
MSSFLIQTLRQTRKNFLRLIENRSNEELNVIPKGFSNNLIWNLGHMVVTQQLLCYAKAGLETGLTADMIAAYRKGSKPENFIHAKETELIKSLALELVDKFEADLDKGIFQRYDPYQTSYGLLLNNIDEAMNFNNVHEGMHLGTGLVINKHI